MEVFFFIGIVISALLGLLIFSKKTRTDSDNIFGIWQIILVVHFSLLYVRHSELIYEHPHFIGIDTSLVLLYIPFIFFYVYASLNKVISSIAYLLHLSPFIAVNIVLTFTFYLFPETIKLEMLLDKSSDIKIYSIVDLLFLIQASSYLPWLLTLLKRNNKNAIKKYATPQKAISFWLEKMVIGACLVLGLNFIIYLLYLSTHLIPSSLLSKISIINLCLFQVTLAYIGIKHTSIFAQVDYDKKRRPAKYYKTGLKKSKSEEYFKSLINHMKTDKPYLDPELDRSMLASKIGISPNHLSQIINQSTKHNFYTFVNQFRIEEAKRILENESLHHYTILAIANDSGFKSKSVFNELFKKHYGMTPSQFRKSNSSSK